MTIHREGHTILFVLLVVLVAINLVISTYFDITRPVENIIIGCSIVLYLLVLQFFRNPAVNTPKDGNLVYAPADGKVVVIEEAEETEYLKEKRKQISIFMSPVNVHVNRNPVSGVVKYFKYHPGKYLVAWHPKSSTENERTSLAVALPNGIEIMIRQVAGAMARRIKWYVAPGQPVVQGEEFGFIKFGSRVDVYLPLDAEILVNIDEKTTAGKTVLARLS